MMMKKLEIFLAICFLVGVLLKLLHLEGAAIVTGLSLSSLAIFYFMVGSHLFNDIPLKQIFNKEADKDMPWLKKLMSNGARVIFAVLLLGMMFKIQNLEGAGVMLSMGFVFSVILIVPILIKILRNASDPVYKRILIRWAIITVFAYIFYN